MVAHVSESASATRATRILRTHCLPHLPKHRFRTLKWRSHISIYLAFAIAFVAYKSLEFHSLSNQILRAYFEDLLALPLVLKTALLLTQASFKNYRRFYVKWGEGLVILTLFSLYFEALLPQLDSRFTADPVDVFCYCAGLVVFMLWLNKPFVRKDLSLFV
jgi:hypothetical protein